MAVAKHHGAVAKLLSTSGPGGEDSQHEDGELDPNLKGHGGPPCPVVGSNRRGGRRSNLGERLAGLVLGVVG
ncbi:MAG: hypothetical protein EB078_13410, partial [Proteobacteria bacterium]|nr:hypothetical protein [Pseudomonadota bacterium]